MRAPKRPHEGEICSFIDRGCTNVEVPFQEAGCQVCLVANSFDDCVGPTARHQQ